MLPPQQLHVCATTNPLTRVDLVTPVSRMNRLRLKKIFFPKLHESNRQSLGFKTLTLPSSYSFTSFQQRWTTGGTWSDLWLLSGEHTGWEMVENWT